MKCLRNDKKIRLMLVIDFIYSMTGGTENQIAKLINNLDGDKYELYLVCLKNTPWMVAKSGELKCKVKAFNYTVFNHKDPRNIISFLGMIKYIKKVNPDIVITFFKTSYILGVLAARLAGVQNIISTRRDYGLWLDDRSIHLLRFANRFVRGIITNSYKVKELTNKSEGFDDSKISVIYNGINSNHFERDRNAEKALKESLGIPAHHNVVGIIAGLRPMKRHRTFLKAAKRVLRYRNDIDFVIVGDGPLRKDLETIASALEIGNDIHFVGWQEDVGPFLSVFDIGVNCSANEGFSNAIMEYMTYGVPCIVSDAGGNPELVEHGINGYTFELDNDEELANQIIGLLDNKERQKEFVSKSKQKILEQLTLEKMIDAYDKYFTQILGITA